jgi:hypothetical protein
MGINYGLNRVRFMAPVRVNSRLRGRFKLPAFEPLEGGAQLTTEVTMELEGSTSRPAWPNRCRGASPVSPPQRWVAALRGPAQQWTRHTRCARSPMKVLLVDDHPLILAACRP